MPLLMPTWPLSTAHQITPWMRPNESTEHQILWHNYHTSGKYENDTSQIWIETKDTQTDCKTQYHRRWTYNLHRLAVRKKFVPLLAVFLLPEGWVRERPAAQGYPKNIQNCLKHIAYGQHWFGSLLKTFTGLWQHGSVLWRTTNQLSKSSTIKHATFQHRPASLPEHALATSKSLHYSKYWWHKGQEQGTAELQTTDFANKVPEFRLDIKKTHLTSLYFSSSFGMSLKGHIKQNRSTKPWAVYMYKKKNHRQPSTREQQHRRGKLKPMVKESNDRKDET